MGIGSIRGGARMAAIAAGLAAPLLLWPARALASGAMAEEEIVELTEDVGGEYGICPELLQAIAAKESGYDPGAENGGCKGLMQVSERWHSDRMERLGVTDLMDPRGNMLVAADYLADLFAKYEDPGTVLMVYSGDSDAMDYDAGEAELSGYASGILEESARLERAHGK